MTIELIDDMIEIAQTVPELNLRVYRAYPSVDANVPASLVPFIVINPAGRNVMMAEDDGSELLVSLSYMVDIYASTMTDLDSIFDKLNSLYSSKGLTNIGYNPTYQPTNELVTANASWTGIVDKRGGVHRG